MPKRNVDTIAAIATPPGRGGVGIVRVSGPDSQAIAQEILKKTLKPRIATYTEFFNDNVVIDSGIALFFQNPHSFTGEDVLELQGHGGPVVLDLLLQRVLSLDARLARPGEFSEQAFLNDKIDLAQAEAIADLIDASSEQAAKSAVKSLQGEFSQKIHELVAGLIHLRMMVEAAIDFPEEDIDFLAQSTIAADLNALISQLKTILATAQQGALLRDGMTVVIAGKPNAGKSSLLNALSGRQSAIVTDIAGTTRDVLREYIHLDGMPLHIIDTAGLRDTDDIVELEGMRRAYAEIEKADLVVLVHDSSDGLSVESLYAELKEKMPDNLPVVIVNNKIDMTSKTPQVEQQNDYVVISLSAKQPLGIELLTQHLKDFMGYAQTQEGTFLARRRHLDALNNALKTLDSGAIQLKEHQAGELLAEDLRQAQQILGEITGEFSSDDLLGQIFSSFCIGK